MKIEKLNDWSLFSRENKFLEPLKWIGGNQNKSVRNIMKAFNENDDDKKQMKIFLNSKCGSGKSTILLNVLKELGRGIIVVPSLMLQDQYNKDYSGDNSMYILKDNKDINSKLKIGTMFGRKNFTCPLQKDALKSGKYYLSNGYIIFDEMDITCAKNGLPCNSPVPKGKTRIGMASKHCEYFIPAPLSEHIIEHMKRPSNDNDSDSVSQLEAAKKKLNCDDIKSYIGIGGHKYWMFMRKDISSTCPYYAQFYNYLEDYCDVIIFNKWKYEIETIYGRKPLVNIECIDEADEFLNGLNETIIITNHMINGLYKINPSKDMNEYELNIYNMKNNLLEIFKMTHEKITKNYKNGDLYGESTSYAKNIINGISKFIEYITDLKNDGKMDIDDKEDHINEMMYKLEIVNEYIDKAAMTTSESVKTFSIEYNIPYPDLILENMMNKSSNKILMCSGTNHENDIRKKLFNLIFDKIIDGRMDQPGNLTIVNSKHGMVNVNYKNWQNDEFKNHYNNLLKYLVINLNDKGNTLVLTPAKKYVEETVKYLRKENADLVIDFSSSYDEKDDGAIKLNNKIGNQITVSYRMKRGIDLKDDECRVVIWTKFPFIDISNGYVKSLFNRFGKDTWNMLNSIAYNDVIQGVCRGLRHNEDYCYFSSPDQRVYDTVMKWWQEQLIIKNKKY